MSKGWKGGVYFPQQGRSQHKNLRPEVAGHLDNVIHIEDYSHMVPAVIMKIMIGVVGFAVLSGSIQILVNITILI